MTREIDATYLAGCDPQFVALTFSHGGRDAFSEHGWRWRAARVE
ncbi:MAG: hypothetical protein ABIZ49_04965 [Opitutaceae bacterium]